MDICDPSRQQQQWPGLSTVSQQPQPASRALNPNKPNHARKAEDASAAGDCASWPSTSCLRQRRSGEVQRVAHDALPPSPSLPPFVPLSRCSMPAAPNRILLDISAALVEQMLLQRAKWRPWQASSGDTALAKAAAAAPPPLGTGACEHRCIALVPP